MSASDENAPAAYNAVMSSKAALGHQLFELLVWDNWYGVLSVALRSYEVTREGITYTYHAEPDFSNSSDPHYVGGSTLEDARRYKARALGEKIDDERLKELVEALLKDELDKYGIELKWMYRHSWDGSDRILCIYPKLLQAN